MRRHSQHPNRNREHPICIASVETLRYAAAMFPFRDSLVLNLVACSLLLAACNRKTASAPAQQASGPARPVQAVRSEIRPMARTITVTGTLAAQESSVLSAKVSGRVQALAVDIGSVVREGELLAQIEPRDYELRLQQAGAALAQARAAVGLPLEGNEDHVQLDRVSTVQQAKAVLEEATRTRERIQRLSQTGIASDSELDTVEANHTVARTRYETARDEARTRTAALLQRRAEYELAQKQLADASLRAPFAGAIQSRQRGLGEYVATGTPMLTLVRVDPLRLRLDVPERESTGVRVGQAVRVFVEGDTNVYTGVISRLSPALNEQNRMLLVEADVPAQGSLQPGRFVRGQIVVQERESVVTVPHRAIVTFAGIEKVVRVQDGKALETTVTTGRRENDHVEVTTGLEAGEVVVLDPAGLRSGQPVQVGGGT